MTRRALGFVTALAIAGCGGQSGPAADPAAATKAPPAPTAEKQPGPAAQEVRPSDPADPNAPIAEGDAPTGPPPPATELAAAPSNVAPRKGPLRFEPAKAGDGRLPHAPEADIGEDGTMLNHIMQWGWAKDGSAFLYCFDNSGPGDCERIPIGAKAKSFAGGTKQWKAALAAAAPLTHGPTTWDYGDVTITWSETDLVLHVGGRIGKAKGKDEVVTFKFDPDDLEGAIVYPEVMSLSPDGTHLAIVAQGALGHSIQEVQARVVETAPFAAAVYSATGFHNLRAGKHEPAATWFARAAATSKHWKHPYNLACARALGKLDGTQTALAQAIERGGDKVKAKARKDADLQSVRAEPWFAALLR